MEVSDSLTRRDQCLQVVQKDTRPLSLMDKLKGGSDEVETLEDMIDVESDLERYQKDTLRKIRPQQLYQMGWFEYKSGLYRISREVELSVLTEPVQLRIVSKQIEKRLKYTGYKYIHQGMYIIGIKGMTRKKLGTKVLITLLDKRWESVHKASLGFLEGDMNENMLITYIAPDLIMPIKEFIDKMVFAFQTKGYEDFKGTNLLVSIEFIGRLTNRSGTRYKVNVNNVIESMQSKGINFRSPLKISSEERAGEEWNIAALIESKTLKQPEDYISYENRKGQTCIRFVDYKEKSLDDLEASSSESNIEENRRHSVCEFMEKLDIDNEIKHYEQKLSKIPDEYNTSMLCEWSAIREKEIYFRREIYRLNKIKKERELNDKKHKASVVIKKWKDESIPKDVQSHKAKSDLDTHKGKVMIDNKELKLQKENEVKIENTEEDVISEDEQWEINNKYLLESYEEKDEDMNESYSKDLEIHMSLQDKDNAIEAMDLDASSSKRRRGPEIKTEEEKERHSRMSGTWPPEKEEPAYSYIPGQYKYMGSKRRQFEKTVQFQNYRSDGAILNLAAHDPIDWPNIISIWKGLIVQKYIQNQHNIGNRVEDMLTYLETFLGESAKVLWEQWIEAFPNYYEELKRAGSNPYNFANIISSIVIGEDPELGYTTLQNERLKEIEKLTLTNWKGIKEFSQHYLYNATTAKQGYNKGIVERYFNKLPDPLGSMIFEEYKKECKEYNISQAITFVFKQLRKICTNIQAQRSMKQSDYNFCNKIVQIPLTYGEERSRNKRYPKNYKKGNVKTKKRYFLRRSDNRAPFLHKRNVRRYNPRKNYDSTCRCFICNSPDHLSKTCPNKDKKRYSSKQEEQEKVLIIDSVNENILVCDDDIMDDESIYSIIETDEVEYDEENETSEEELDLIDELAGLKIEMMDQVICNHECDYKGDKSNIKCVYCIYYQDPGERATCSLCLRQACMACLEQKNNEKVENKLELVEEVSLEKDKKEYKYLGNTPQEFLVPRISFKTEQVLSCFTQDIIDLIWSKYAERQYKTFLDIQNYFIKLYQGKERQLGIIAKANIFPLLHIDDKLIVKPRHKFIIFKADINLKYFRSIQRNTGNDISLQTIIDHGLAHDIYGTLGEICQSDLGIAIKEAAKKLACVQGRYRIRFCSNPPKFTQPIRPASHDIYITKGSYKFPTTWSSDIWQNYEALFANNANHDKWRIFTEAREIEGNTKFDPEYYMMYQNKIIKIFLREYYGKNSIIQREVGRLIKPNYGAECELRKEYRELLAWYEIWQPEDADTEVEEILQEEYQQD